MGLESSGVYQQFFTFWSVNLQPLGAYRYTIPHMKGDIHSFNMRYNSMTCTKRLQRYSFWNCLIGPSLVCTMRRTSVYTTYYIHRKLQTAECLAMVPI